MAYQKQNFQNDRVLDADELNHIEDGIEELERQLGNISPGGDTPTPATSDDLFLVTIDHNAKTASHSESEIKAAKESGKVVVTMDRYGMLMPLYDADSGCFEGIYRSGSDKLLYERYTVAEDKSVTIEQGEVNDNFLITVNGDQKTCDKTYTEVQQALEGGKDIIVRFVRSIGTLLVYPVIVVSDGGIVISIVYHSSTTKNTAASVVMMLMPDNRFDMAVGEASFPPAANNVADGKVLTVSNGNAVWSDPPASGTGPKGDKGDKGDPGEDGADGKDGASTTISMTRVDSGNQHGVKLTTRTQDGDNITFDTQMVNDGTDGNPGKVYVPTVTQNGNTLEMSFQAQAGTLPAIDRSYTIELPEGGGSDDLFLVTVDWNTDTASHSSEEIAAAVASGKIAFMTDGSGTYDLQSTHENACYFGAAYYAGNESYSIMVDRQKKVEYSEHPVYTPPVFDLTAMGMPAVPITNGRVDWYHDTRDLYAALKAGTVKIKYSVLSLSGDEEHMECTVNGLANSDASFIQITVLGRSTGGNRLVLYAYVYEDGIDAYTGSLGGLEIDTVDMGLTLTQSFQSLEMTEAAFEKLQAIVAAGPVRLRWQVNFGTESAPYLVESHADLTPVTARSANGNYESITFAVIDGQYSYYISFLRDGSYYGVDYKVFSYEVT